MGRQPGREAAKVGARRPAAAPGAAPDRGGSAQGWGGADTGNPRPRGLGPPMARSVIGGLCPARRLRPTTLSEMRPFREHPKGLITGEGFPTWCKTGKGPVSEPAAGEVKDAPSQEVDSVVDPRRREGCRA